MRKTAIAIFLGIVALSFALGVAQDYLEGGALSVQEGGQASYGIRVYNTLDQPISFKIQPVADMQIVQIANAQEIYQLPAKGRQEINLVVTVPQDTRTSYRPTFIVNEIKPNDPKTMVDTAVSPKISFSVNVLPGSKPASSGVQGATGFSLIGFVVGIVSLLAISLVIYHFAEKK